MFRSLRSILDYSRLPLKVGAIRNAKVYRVRFVKSNQDPSVGKTIYAAKTLYSAAFYSLAVIIGYRIVSGVTDKPIFIPLGFPRPEPPRRFTPQDPEVASFHRFNRDSYKTKKARSIFEDKTVKLVESNFADRVGTDAKQVRSMLYFHYPAGPSPGYRQRGLQVSYRPNNHAASEPDALIDIVYADRQMDRNRHLHNQTILYPRWMFQALKNSVVNIWNAINSPAKPGDDRIEDFNDLLQYSMDLSEWTLKNLKDDLQRTRPRMHPPGSDVVIDGFVQVIGNDTVVLVDITGSFNPENIEEAAIHRASVRFMSKLRRPVEQQQLKNAMASGVKLDPEAAEATSKLNDKMIDASKALADQLRNTTNNGGKQENVGSSEIVKRLVDTDSRDQKGPDIKANKESSVPELRHETKNDVSRKTGQKDIDSPTPSTSSEPHPPSSPTTPPSPRS
jgi:hypothetical protein